MNSLLKKGTGSEQCAISSADFKLWRRACPLFQQAVKPILPEIPISLELPALFRYGRLA
jgi:hypothetical protein